MAKVEFIKKTVKSRFALSICWQVAFFHVKYLFKWLIIKVLKVYKIPHPYPIISKNHSRSVSTDADSSSLRIAARSLRLLGFSCKSRRPKRTMFW